MMAGESAFKDLPFLGQEESHIYNIGQYFSDNRYEVSLSFWRSVFFFYPVRSYLHKQTFSLPFRDHNYLLLSAHLMLNGACHLFEGPIRRNYTPVTSWMATEAQLCPVKGTVHHLISAKSQSVPATHLFSTVRPVRSHGELERLPASTEEKAWQRSSSGGGISNN